MLSEWHPVSGVQLTFPHSRTDWNYMLEEVVECYVQLALEISRRTKLLVVTPNVEETKNILEQHLPLDALQNIVYFSCDSNDTWARDHAFISVKKDEGKEISLMDYRFDGWGGKFDANLDNAINHKLYTAEILNGQYTDCLDFILEGGSIESDGKHTILTTSKCLLNPNRNKDYSKEDIEKRLAEDLGAKNILWLDYGYLAGDDTDSHIDTLARLCPNNTILYVACEDAKDEHYAELKNMEQQLKTFKNTENKPFILKALPMPEPIIFDGERLPATYANFLIMNETVLVPTYKQSEKDELVMRIIQETFKDYEIVGIDCTALIKQHGSLHCATMQYPKGVIN